MNPLLLFAPGAGAPSSIEWMTRWATALSAVGRVVPFDYEYMRQGRKRPDRLPQLIEAQRAALEAAQTKDAAPVFLIGKSMGGRVGCHLSLEEPVAGVICLGYPLCAAGDRTKLRDQVLLSMESPILFVQGTRDPLCPLDLLMDVRRRMRAKSSLHVVEGGDHSLTVTKSQLRSSGQSQEDVDRTIIEEIRTFVAQNLTQATQ